MDHRAYVTLSLNVAAHDTCPFKVSAGAHQLNEALRALCPEKKGKKYFQCQYVTQYTSHTQGHHPCGRRHIMCQRCANDVASNGQPASPSRRNALSMIGAISLLGMSAAVQAAQSKPPPKPHNALTPEEAIQRLMAGNERYVSGETRDKVFASTRAALTRGQNPYACILSCADSRVSPELCFDEERGDLFVTRVAGNYVTNDILASLEYGVAVLNTPLIMVLGHTRCGAISAAVSSHEKRAEFPGHIQTIITALLPAVRAAAGTSYTGTLTEASTVEDIRQNVKRLEKANPIISAAVLDKRTQVVGGIYDLETGKVQLVT